MPVTYYLDRNAQMYPNEIALMAAYLFRVLKSGAIAVPFNFRYDAEEILYCTELAEVQAQNF